MAKLNAFDIQKELNKKQKEERLGLFNYNNQGCLMKIIEYKETRHVKIKFIDSYGYEKETEWRLFKEGNIRNPYYPEIYNVGFSGIKYPIKQNNKVCKEYRCWSNMLRRCFCKEEKEKCPTYTDVTCCEEWLNYENFYEWLHSQENFEKWLNNSRWSLDKDILIKGNKIYSPETCCLVPNNVNILFIKRSAGRGDFPIGVSYNKQEQRYSATISMQKNNRVYHRNQGFYPTPEDAFYLGYKPTKERYIQKIAQEEYELGNITKACHDAMMNYQVEITD